MSSNYISKQLVYFGNVTAAGAFTAQMGPGLMTIAVASSVYTVTLPANFTVPLDRRFVVVTTNNPAATPGSSVTYDHAASTASTAVFRGAAAGGTALDTAFFFEIYRFQFLP
jgi:hypothetical protein